MGRDGGQLAEKECTAKQIKASDWMAGIEFDSKPAAAEVASAAADERMSETSQQKISCGREHVFASRLIR